MNLMLSAIQGLHWLSASKVPMQYIKAHGTWELVWQYFYQIQHPMVMATSIYTCLSTSIQQYSYPWALGKICVYINILILSITR